MADSKIEQLANIWDSPIVAESLNHYQKRYEGCADLLKDSIKQTAQLTCANIGASASQIDSFTAQYPLEILAVYAVRHGVTGNPTATMVNFDGTTSKNPIAGTNIDLGALTADHIPEAETVSTTQANLEMDTGDNLRCTFAAAAGEAVTAATVTIVYRPIQTVS